MACVIMMIKRFFLDQIMVLVLTCYVVVMATNRLDVVRVPEIVMRSVTTFVVIIFAAIADGKFTRGFFIGTGAEVIDNGERVGRMFSFCSLDCRYEISVAGDFSRKSMSW